MVVGGASAEGFGCDAFSCLLAMLLICSNADQDRTPGSSLCVGCRTKPNLSLAVALTHVKTMPTSSVFLLNQRQTMRHCLGHVEKHLKVLLQYSL